MFSWIGFNSKLATNSVTWGVIAMVSAVAARNDRNLTSCAAMSPVVGGATRIPEYYVGRYENIAFDICTAAFPIVIRTGGRCPIVASAAAPIGPTAVWRHSPKSAALSLAM
jgi:hypothetical protein